MTEEKQAAPRGRGSAVLLSIHEDLAPVEHEWRVFEQRADCTVFQSFGWLSAWQRHVGVRRGTRPVVVTGRDAAGELLFLLPLSVESHGFVRRLTWLGSDLGDYNAPLLAPGFSRQVGARRWLQLWPEILRHVQAHPGLRFDVVSFVRMPERVGAQRNPFRLLPVTTHPSGAHHTHLAGEWATFYAARRSRATRQRDRTKLNRLREIGEVKLVTPDAPEDVAATVDAMMAQKRRAFAAMGIADHFARPGHAEFYRSLATDPATAAISHLSRLDVGPVPAAINLGLKFRGRYYHVLASYDGGEAARYGPGAAHLHELMRHAIECGCGVFDFTVGDEPYKRDWADTEWRLFDHIAAARWRGAIVSLPSLGLIRAKRFVKQTPLAWKAFSRMRAWAGVLRGFARPSAGARRGPSPSPAGTGSGPSGEPATASPRRSNPNAG